MKVHTISFSCWSCLFAKVLKRRRRVAQIRASKKGAAPKYKNLFQVQLTSLLSMKTTWFWSERQLNSLDETMIFQVWNE